MTTMTSGTSSSSSKAVANPYNHHAHLFAFIFNQTFHIGLGYWTGLVFKSIHRYSIAKGSTQSDTKSPCAPKCFCHLAVLKLRPYRAKISLRISSYIEHDGTSDPHNNPIQHASPYHLPRIGIITIGSPPGGPQNTIVRVLVITVTEKLCCGIQVTI